MFSSFKESDVTLLLKDITGQVTPLPTEVREKAIQSGTPYSEMLPIEYAPTEAYLSLYEKALARYKKTLARAVANVSMRIYAKNKRPVLVSLARAGTPIGILLKRYMDKRFGLDTPHYTISIIRGVGIDTVAMDYILSRHAPEDIQFVDGWIGKGAIQRQLNLAMKDYPGVDPLLAVISDPAGITPLIGTREDFLIPSSCLNSTVSGLLSRTVYRKDIIGPKDFHGVHFYRELSPLDRTYEFIDTVVNEFDFSQAFPGEEEMVPAAEEVAKIAEEFGIDNINLVKPSVGEATRVLLRRVPWKMLVCSLDDEENLGHIYLLAKEKGVPVELYPLRHYRAVGLIKNFEDQ